MGHLRRAVEKQQLLLCQQGEKSAATCVKHFVSAYARKLVLYSGGYCSSPSIQVTHDEHRVMLGVKQLQYSS